MNPEQMIDQIASKQMGVDPAMPAEAEAAPAPAPQPAPQEAPDSEQEIAAADGSPQTEGDKSAEEAIIYSIDMGNGKTRDLTPNQIKSTMERYSQLNYKHAQNKPVMDLMDRVAEANPNMKPDQLAAKLAAILKAGDPNATMGKQNVDTTDKQPDSNVSQGNVDEMLSAWEEENAASLPPMYKEMMAGNKNSMSQMQSQMAQMGDMLQKVLAQSSGMTDAAAEGMEQARSTEVNGIQQSIANNIDRLQQELGLPDDKAQDFLMYAGDRGYTLEDFVDARLTQMVMQDFKNNMDSPELDRMREMNKKRQAFTGSLGPTPSAAQGGAPAPQASRFDELSSGIIDKRI